MISRYTVGGSNPQVYYTAYSSPDGSTWSPVSGSTVALNMAGPLLAGISITSHMQGVASTVTLDTVAVNTGEFPPPGYGCVAGWTCADIGTATPVGQQTLAGGIWTIQGGGSDIFGTADSFHFVSEPLSADGNIAARVVSQTTTSAWAKAGLMMRATTDPGSPYYAILVTPSNGVVVQWRTTQGAGTNQIAMAGSVPIYIQVTRTGTTFAAETSSDGVTWTPVTGSSVSLPNLSGAILRGFAGTSHSNGHLGTVVFDTVTTVP